MALKLARQLPGLGHTGRKWGRGGTRGGLPASLIACGALFGCASASGVTISSDAQLEASKEIETSNTDLVNWSGTHSVDDAPVTTPERKGELLSAVQRAAREKTGLRPIGSCLSPNGIGFKDSGMLSMALQDNVLAVDPEAREITVEAGIRVSQVVEALRPHGLTLQNYASIAEQQIGGFIQVGAHGTGARIPPVDEQVTSMELVTPAKGELILDEKSNAELFSIAKVGLGSLGVVSQVTLKCVPMHKLTERTTVVSRADVRANHSRWLNDNQHLRYMWIPFTDSVVVVACNPASEQDEKPDADAVVKGKPIEPLLREAKELLVSESAFEKKDLDGLSFTQLRDRLLALRPLDIGHIKRVNEIEAEYWKSSSGSRVDFSDRILGFDCGGQQLVSEVCFPVGSLESPTLRDIDFMEDLLEMIESGNGSVAAASPLEQRWTARSTSPMSVAFSDSPDQVFCWVGVIMYLPTEEELAPGSSSAGELEPLRSEIMSAFAEYRGRWERDVWRRYWAAEHWAKIEYAKEEEKAVEQRRYLAERVAGFRALQSWARELDPDGILGNKLLRELGVCVDPSKREE